MIFWYFRMQFRLHGWLLGYQYFWKKFYFCIFECFVTSKSSSFKEDYRKPRKYVKSKTSSFYLGKLEWKLHCTIKSREHFCKIDYFSRNLLTYWKNADVSKAIGILFESSYFILFAAKFHYYGIYKIYFREGVIWPRSGRNNSLEEAGQNRVKGWFLNRKGLFEFWIDFSSLASNLLDISLIF